MEQIVAILGALGGFEAIKWGITTWLHRRTDARREEAAADALEQENHQRHIDWLERRLEQRDRKIDALYAELRESQSVNLQLVHEKHALELELKEATIRRCNVRGCANRQPPSEY